MPLILHNNTPYMTVNEIMQLLEDFKNDMENKRSDCLRDIKGTDLLEPIRNMCVKITNLDYDMFMDCLDTAIIRFQKQIKEDRNWQNREVIIDPINKTRVKK
jgi:hypothetical protein